MSTITFITPALERIEVPVKPGTSVMEAAIAKDVPGIEAQCYGAGVCGTCHVYAEDGVHALLEAPSSWEREMLEALPLATAESRLSCQLRFQEKLEGAVFRLPERQDPM